MNSYLAELLTQSTVKQVTSHHQRVKATSKTTVKNEHISDFVYLFINFTNFYTN